MHEFINTHLCQWQKRDHGPQVVLRYRSAISQQGQKQTGLCLVASVSHRTGCEQTNCSKNIYGHRGTNIA